MKMCSEGPVIRVQLFPDLHVRGKQLCIPHGSRFMVQDGAEHSIRSCFGSTV